ncbi:MAG: FAD-dependent oxidoreductase, partial [Actinomycetota bacterium]|nr:FAD-dependent oxidoreductase [Actinomycetota bacterium]
MRVAIIGAGLTGLIAGRELVRGGADVVVFDKGRSPGGRLATRRIGGATLDHGAQFFTVRSPAFARQIADWEERGLVHVWNNGFDGADGHPRYVATNGMSSLAKDLAADLDVQCSTMVFALRDEPHVSGITVAIDDGMTHTVDAAIVTCPVPQAFALMIDGGIELDETLFRTDYDRTVGLLVR